MPVPKTETDPPAFVVKVDPLLLPLIPGYLEHRRKDLQGLADALAAGDLGAARKIGHNMYGSGGAFGLPPVSALGKRIEDGALAGDAAAIAAARAELEQFLATVRLPA